MRLLILNFSRIRGTQILCINFVLCHFISPFAGKVGWVCQEYIFASSPLLSQLWKVILRCGRLLLALLISEIPESPCPWLAALKFVIHSVFVVKLGILYYTVT